MIKGNKGASLLEYGLTAGLIGAVSIGGVYATGISAESVFSGVVSEISERLAGNGNVSSGGEGGSEEAPVETAASCYDPGNVGTVGAPGMTGCAGMYIVSDALLRSAASSYVSGDESFSFVTGEGTFTFEDDGSNIFTGQATLLDHLFYQTSFNGDIGYWDTSNVESLMYTFSENPVFNQDISSWDVADVWDMERTFAYAHAFDQPIGNWDTSSVVYLLGTFGEAISFNQDLSGWDTSSVIDMDCAFCSAWAFDQDISNWTTSAVTDMRYMFGGASVFNQDISSWDTSNVENMNGMFLEASLFSQDLSGWNVANVSSHIDFGTDSSLVPGQWPVFP